MSDIVAYSDSSVKRWKDTICFSPAATTYKETGKYCPYRLSESYKSRYYKFWAEERKRCLEGYTVNGETITGYHYFYLNYCPIWLIQYEEEGDGENIMTDRLFDFPQFYDRDYDYFHYVQDLELYGEHGVVLKARRRGYSNKAASMMNRNYFLIPGSKSYAIAYDKQYLITDGVITKAWEMMDFIDQHTAWTKRRNYKNQDMHRRASYTQIVSGLRTEKGYKSDIIALTLKDNNVDKIRGKAGKLIFFEEAGYFPNLLSAWNIALRSIHQGTKTIGTMIAFGTGGKVDKGLIGLEELFYNSGYKTRLLPNIFDEKITKDMKCGFFHSASSCMQGFIDKDGNSDEEGAKKYILEDRRVVKENSRDPLHIIKYIAEDPLNPQEALLRIGGIFFPVSELKHHLAEILSEPKNKEKEYVGYMDINSVSGKIEFVESDTVTAIYSYPLDNKSSSDGAIVIYEKPVLDKDNNIPYNIYISACDPYFQDKSGTSSLGSVFIMNVLTDKLVAEYTGRPATMDIFFEQTRRLLLYYNARCNYENTDKGMFTYFENRNCGYLLADTPRILYSKVDDKSVLQRGKGTPPTLVINSFGRELIKIWLMTPITKDSEFLMLHTIRSVPLLKELIYWDKFGNFDRVSSLSLLMILRENYFKEINNKDEDNKDDYYEDEFFNRTYRSNREMTNIMSFRLKYENMKM